jgi:MoxR-like ATPase
VLKGEVSMSHLLEAVYDRVVGRKDEILMIVSALAAGRHLFLEGPPGTSKSTILRAVAECSEAAFCLVTGNSDLTTSKLIGYFDPAETLSRGYCPEHFYPGPLLLAMKDGMYLYVEEFNRLPDETTNVFVTVMSENKLAVPRLGVVEAHEKFRIIAALNPLDDIGISRISRALKDRFCSFKMEYQSRDEEIEIVKRVTGEGAEDLIEFAVDMARGSRKHPDLKLGASVRASIDMVLIYRQALRILDVVETEEAGQALEKLLLNSVMMAFRNRIWLYEISEKSPEQIVEDIFFGLRGAKKKTMELKTL